MMGGAFDPSRFAILFVDDEEQSRKYFARALSPGYRILTASDVEEALAIMEAHKDEIGVLVTDQRMPGRPGVDLLAEARERYPQIIRMLTTGYSDLSEAVRAVNRGEIFRYIGKPWDLDSLKSELAYALELFALRRERELLLNEKLSVRRRQSRNGRIHDLILLAGALTNMRHTLQAVQAFVGQLTACEEDAEQASAGWGHQDMFQAETRRMLALVRQVAEHVSEAHAIELSNRSVNVGTLAEAAGLCVFGAPIRLQVECKSPSVWLWRSLVLKLFTLLFEELKGLGGDVGRGTTPSAHVGNGDDGIRVALSCEGATWPRAQGSLLSSHPEADILVLPMHAGLLSAFYLAHHSGGCITVKREPSDCVSFDVWLPIEPEAADVDHGGDAELEELLSWCEA